MTHFTAGFLFSEDRTLVALIRKVRGPESVRGRLNAIGGHVEAGENLHRCQSREFLEETGTLVPPRKWEKTVVLRGSDWTVTFFRAFVPEAVLRGLVSATDEVVGLYDPLEVGGLDVVPNLRWLLPLSADRDVLLPVVIHDGGG